jgi:hypothetical protein
MLIAAFVVMQFIISAKAGLVNAVEGTANVRLQEQVPAGALIQTAPKGRVEILLNPGSFLRLDENSEAVLDSVDLTNIAVHILAGSAIIQSTSIDKDTPIRVTNGALSVLIVAPGAYRFSENTAFVLDGELRTEDSNHLLKGGWQIRASSGDQGPSYDEAKIDAEVPVTPFEFWSRDRARQIAAADSRAADTDSASNSLAPSDPLYSSFPAPFLYPGGPLPYPGGTLPSYGYSPRLNPSFSPFLYYPWYSGGYSYYQPYIPTPPIFIPYYVGPRRPVLRPSPYVPRPPATTPYHPAPRPIPSRPGGGMVRGRR